MNVRPAELTQPMVKISVHSSPAAPNAGADAGRGFFRSVGLLPLVVFVIALCVTVAWIGFLLWQAAAFAFGLIGL